VGGRYGRDNTRGGFGLRFLRAHSLSADCGKNLSEISELVDHLLERAVRTDGPFTLRSGEVSNWYIDARQTTYDGRGARLIGEALLEVLDHSVEAVGGMTMGADPLAIATAVVGTERPLRAFSIRKAAKEHGVGGRIVGPVKSGDRVAVLEDTTTTGGAFIEAIDVALGAGLVVLQAVALIDRSRGKVLEMMKDRGIPYRWILTPTDLGLED